MDRKELMKMFNRESRIGVLSTADATGKVDAAVFGSPRMIDTETVVMAIGNNRSYANLQENPNACFIVVEPGTAPMEWKGFRLYLQVDTFERYGELLDSFRNAIRKLAGDRSADAIEAAIRFRITDIRPLIAPAS